MARLAKTLVNDLSKTQKYTSLVLQLQSRKEESKSKRMTVAELGQLNLDQLPPSLGVSRTVDCYQNLEQIGEGTYG